MNATESEHIELERASTGVTPAVVGDPAVHCRGWRCRIRLVKQQTKQYTATTSVVFPNPELQQQASGLQVIPTSPTEDPTIMATNIQLLTSQVERRLPPPGRSA